MSDAVIIAVLVAIPPTLIALAGLIQSVLNGKKQDITNKKADEIHILVNSNMSAVKLDLATALNRIASLEQMLDARNKPAGDY